VINPNTGLKIKRLQNLLGPKCHRRGQRTASGFFCVPAEFFTFFGQKSQLRLQIGILRPQAGPLAFQRRNLLCQQRRFLIQMPITSFAMPGWRHANNFLTVSEAAVPYRRIEHSAIISQVIMGNNCNPCFGRQKAQNAQKVTTKSAKDSRRATIILPLRIALQWERPG